MPVGFLLKAVLWAASAALLSDRLRPPSLVHRSLNDLLGVFRSRSRHRLGLNAGGDSAGDAQLRRRINAQGGSFPLINWLAEGARGLSAYFALVMATGIVSIASDRAAPCDCRCPPVAERGAASAALDSHGVAAVALSPRTA